MKKRAFSFTKNIIINYRVDFKNNHLLHFKVNHLDHIENTQWTHDVRISKFSY